MVCLTSLSIAEMEQWRREFEANMVQDDVDTRLARVEISLKHVEDNVADHEIRLRAVEHSNWQLAALVGAVTTILTFAGHVLMKYL